MYRIYRKKKRESQANFQQKKKGKSTTKRCTAAIICAPHIATFLLLLFMLLWTPFFSLYCAANLAISYVFSCSLRPLQPFQLEKKGTITRLSGTFLIDLFMYFFFSTIQIFFDILTEKCRSEWEWSRRKGKKSKGVFWVVMLYVGTGEDYKHLACVYCSSVVVVVCLFAYVLLAFWISAKQIWARERKELHKPLLSLSPSPFV